MPRPPVRVLVVYKKSAYQLHLVEGRHPALRRLYRRGDPDARDMRQAHEVHQRTLAAVIGHLKRRRVRFDLVYRATLTSTARHDLIVAVGGDGTFLQASHLIADAPVLGVNSDPDRSEAVFCAAAAATFPRLFDEALARRLPEQRLHRLVVRLNDHVVAPLVLNDALIAHTNPATMSRYRLAIGPHREDHKSSGLWVATAAGSSSAILAAGGRRLPWSSTRFQYRPRELYKGRLSHARLQGGLLSLTSRVEVTWLMREGAIFIDGPHLRHALQFGDRITVSPSRRHPLRVLGLKAAS
jgi:NAD+ kinase